METQSIVMWLVLVIYNVATIKLLSVLLSRTDLKSAVAEKSVPATQRAAEAPAVSDQGAPASSSRLSSLIGAVVLASFFWAVGNVILYKSFSEPAAISGYISNLSQYFLAGAALFVPYGFNQLREAFSPK